jgi:hypothetical protein
MNNHPIHYTFAVQEGFERTPRELERRQLIRIAKGQHERQGTSHTALWNSLIGWTRRVTGSDATDSSEPRSFWAEPGELQEQCC